MVNGINKISFIPDNSEDSKIKYKSAGFGLFSKLFIFLFVFSLLVWGGFFVYKKIISRQIDELSVSIERAKASFDESLISELEITGNNIAVAKKLLEKHLFSSNIFRFLEETTLKEVLFTNFEFDYIPANPLLFQKTSDLGEVLAKLKGESNSYLVLAQQAEVFEQAEEVKSFSFSDFALTDEGRVGFSLELKFKPEILSNK